MSTYRGLILAGAALVLSTMAGQAADLYAGAGGGSLKDSYVPVAHSGCPSWYARVDAGYASYDRPSASEINIDDYLRPSIDDTWSIGGGIGRYISCNIRADVTVDHRYDSDFKGSNGNIYSPAYGKHTFGYESTAVLLNFYYDFDLRSRFTPYVGFGFGVAHNQINSGRGTVGAGALASATPPVARGTAGTALTVESSDRWQAAGALMTGFTFAMRDRLKFDAGYRFLYLGEVQTGDIKDVVGGNGGPTRIEELHAHEFRVGLRYDIR